MTESFEESLEKVVAEESNKIETENGALGYKATYNKLVDLNFLTSSFRGAFVEDIQRRFAEVYNEDPVYALKWLFYARDVRGGMGERRLFRACLNWLYDSYPNVLIHLIHLVPEFGRWDDVIYLARPEYNDEVTEFIFNYVNTWWNIDVLAYENLEPLTLLAKWMPSNNASSKQTVKYAKFYQKKLGITPKEYRQTLSALRARISVVEQKMSANEWKYIEYGKVPSKASMLYRKAFSRHDSDGYDKYLEEVCSGKEKINAGTLYPHDIVHAYGLSDIGRYICIGDEDRLDSREDFDVTLEEQWKNLPDYFTDDVLVVRDGSGSMEYNTIGGPKVRPLDISTGLAVYTAQHNRGAFKNKFITFSADAKLVTLDKETLYDNLVDIYEHDDCSNTNLENVFDLILKTAIDGGYKQEDIPSTVMIVSDMEFDHATWNSRYSRETLFETIAAKYESHGYKLPRLVFWNVCSRTGAIPMIQNENGLVLLSGFSPAAIKMVQTGEYDPWLALKSVLDSDRYESITLN